MKYYNAISDTEKNSNYRSTDKNEHGTHLTSIVANKKIDLHDGNKGIAPDVELVIVKALTKMVRGSPLIS
ncbi:MAG: hypothetical protein ACJA2O_002620 [Candidatus Azotimanducaceae bacterium]|jgi:hypothetical protein